MSDRVLVTGGAGYIGSHTALQLVEAGHDVVILDDLYSGNRWAVPSQANFQEGRIQDRALVTEIIKDCGIGSVIHFAGHVVVPESVENPAKYYDNNVVGSFNLINCCIENGVSEFIFSSSAAVYGTPAHGLISEDDPVSPINPYGTSKLITEWMLRDIAAAMKDRFRFAALRYFNVAGAHMGGKLGQSTPEATHLIKVACQAACGLRPYLSIFGDDYPTPDGTCIRDYIHVDDLAAAHLCALDHLRAGGDNLTLNCGYGRGFSVHEVVDKVKAVSGRDFEVRMDGRQPGDPPELVADNRKILQQFSWNPQYNDLGLICKSAFDWELSQATV